jgi:peptidoglycan/LPS O-acetylase OafA/YrhL
MFPQRSATPEVAAPATRDPALDGLRGVAVLLVFLFHYGGGLKSPNPALHLLGTITSMGWIGVQMFFALSGFLITGSLWESINEKYLIRNFFIRRALRILPLYGIALLVSAVGAYLFDANSSTFQALIIYVFMLQDIPILSTMAQYYFNPYPLYHLWSIAVEEQFYLLWPPLLLSVDNRRGVRRLCVRLFALSAFFRLIVCLPDLSYNREAFYTNFLITHAGGLALGGAVAMALRSRDNASGRIASPVRFVRRYAGWAFWGGLGIFLLAGLIAGSYVMSLPLMFMFGLPAITISSAALIPILLRKGALRSTFSFAPLAGLGRISYGFYVYHILLMPWVDTFATDVTHSYDGNKYQLARLLFAFPLSIVISLLSYKFIELPLMGLGKRFPMRPPVPPGLRLASEVSNDRVRTRQITPAPMR